MGDEGLAKVTPSWACFLFFNRVKNLIRTVFNKTLIEKYELENDTCYKKSVFSDLEEVVFLFFKDVIKF